MGAIQYTDEEIIEWMKKFDTRGDLRNSDFNMYAIIMRRPQLKLMMPPKRTRGQNIVGTKEERLKETKEEKRQRRLQVKLEKEEEQRLLKEEKMLLKRSKVVEKTAKYMYHGTKLDNGKIICGRCFEEKDSSKMNKSICRVCYNRYMYLRMMNKDHNLNNVRDEFCHTKLTHHEKVFEIGIKVDDRTEKYLTMIGYGFIFKDPYDESKYY